MLLDYTTYDDIRAALGVTAEEIDDATLALETWENHLQFEMDDIGSGIPAGYSAVLVIPEESRTAAQARLYRAARLFTTLAVANSLTASLPMFGPKDISDGKATVSRFADSPYRATVSKIREQFEKAKDRLRSAWADVNASTATLTPRSYLGTVPLGTDPVTG